MCVCVCVRNLSWKCLPNEGAEAAVVVVVGEREHKVEEKNETAAVGWRRGGGDLFEGKKPRNQRESHLREQCQKCPLEKWGTK